MVFVLTESFTLIVSFIYVVSLIVEVLVTFSFLQELHITAAIKTIVSMERIFFIC